MQSFPLNSKFFDDFKPDAFELLGDGMTKRALFALVLMGAVGFTACGRKMESTTKTAEVAPANIPAASNGQKPQSTLPGETPGGSKDANAQTTIANYPFFGTYKGTILQLEYGTPVGLQNFTLTIGKTPVPGSTDIYLTMNLMSSGASGTIGKSSYLGVVTGSNSGSYIFVSEPFAVENWSNRKQVLEIYLSFSSSNALVASMSRVYMRECGFSDSTICTNLSSDIGFGLDLIKQ